MKVSFVIPNYNGEKYIRDCMCSIYRQDLSEIQELESFEVIVVDNGSLDDSISIIEREFPDTKVILLGENKGVACALNKGIEIAKGDYIAVLHVDTVLSSGWLCNSIKTMFFYNNVFSSASLIFKDQNSGVIDSAGLGFAYSGYSYKRGEYSTEGNYRKINKVKGVMAPSNAAALYNAAVLRNLGGFDDGFFMYLEDADIGLRAVMRGYENVYNPNALAYHGGFGSANGEECDYAVRFRTRNNIYIRYKNLTPNMRFKNSWFLSNGIKKLKRKYKRAGFRSEVEQGLSEAMFSHKKLKKEYKGSKLSYRTRTSFKLFVGMFESK